MQLITAPYLELQRDLHARFDYGRGVDAQECARFVRLFSPETVLDYGCGQGHLAKLLPEFEVEEYDPAIPGKDAEPAKSDVVVCADVLEHIEPDLLDNVLLHLRALTKKQVILVIATAPSKKIMADGRSAHLIVESARWWAEKVSSLFDLEMFEDRTEQGRGALLIGTPRIMKEKLPIGRIRVSSAVSNKTRNAQVEQNCRRIEKRLALDVAKHDRTAVLVCYGPSLRQTWPQIALDGFQGDRDVYSVSGSHRFLIERGIVPTAHIDCDPREHKVKMLGEPHPQIKYWIASCIHPSYLDALGGFDVSLWHSYNGKTSLKAKDVYPNQMMVTGGGSVGLRAISLLYSRGYRTFDIHGMDCCYADDGADHAAEHSGKPTEVAPVECNGRWFKATAIQIAYLRYFTKSRRMFPDAMFRFHGDGLLQHSQKG